MRTTIAATLLAAMPLFSIRKSPYFVRRASCATSGRLFPAYDHPTRSGLDQIKQTISRRLFSFGATHGWRSEARGAGLVLQTDS